MRFGCTAAAGLCGLIGSLSLSVYHAFHTLLSQTGQTEGLTEGQTDITTGLHIASFAYIQAGGVIKET